jgi:hypothetical protein
VQSHSSAGGDDLAQESDDVARRSTSNDGHCLFIPVRLELFKSDAKGKHAPAPIASSHDVVWRQEDSAASISLATAIALQ